MKIKLNIVLVVSISAPVPSLNSSLSHKVKSTAHSKFDITGITPHFPTPLRFMFGSIYSRPALLTQTIICLKQKKCRRFNEWEIFLSSRKQQQQQKLATSSHFSGYLVLSSLFDNGLQKHHTAATPDGRTFSQLQRLNNTVKKCDNRTLTNIGSFTCDKKHMQFFAFSITKAGIMKIWRRNAYLYFDHLGSKMMLIKARYLTKKNRSVYDITTYQDRGVRCKHVLSDSIQELIVVSDGMAKECKMLVVCFSKSWFNSITKCLIMTK